MTLWNTDCTSMKSPCLSPWVNPALCGRTALACGICVFARDMPEVWCMPSCGCWWAQWPNRLSMDIVFGLHMCRVKCKCNVQVWKTGCWSSCQFEERQKAQRRQYASNSPKVGEMECIQVSYPVKIYCIAMENLNSFYTEFGPPDLFIAL